MVNLLPAVIIGGPPHAGKSVLFYSLTKTLHERGIVHHAVRACPDGEGNWFQEIYESVGLDEVRHICYSTRQWTDSFVQGICADLERRHLPFLVDVGGRPQDEQRRIFLNCTHSILLLKPEDEESARLWRDLVAACGLLPIAELRSEREGAQVLDAASPVIQGTLTSLHRGSLVQGPVFEALVERLAALFSSYSLEELAQAKLATAPVHFTINLDPLLRSINPAAQRWTQDMLARLAREVHAGQPLAIYGKGPNWLFGALAAQAAPASFYQFDPRIGWLTPPTLQVSTQPPPEEITHELRLHENAHAAVLTVRLVNEYLDYLQAERLPFPPVPAEYGLILDGKLPLWMFTALVRLYQDTDVAWIACHQPQLHGAVVVMSRSHVPAVGDLMPLSGA